MKRKIALLVSMIQLLCYVLPIGQVSADYKSQLATEIANAYYNKACEFVKERNSGSRFSIAFYVYDIDKDGIPELIALDTVALGSMNYYFYTYSNGEVKDCGSLLTRYFEWPRTYNDGNGIVVQKELIGINNYIKYNGRKFETGGDSRRQDYIRQGCCRCTDTDSED